MLRGFFFRHLASNLSVLLSFTIDILWCAVDSWLWLFYRSQPTSVNIFLISIFYLWDSLQTWFEVSLTLFITNRVPAKADIHCSLTLEYSAFDLHKVRAEWFSLFCCNSSLLDVPLLCLILQPDLMIQWLSLFVTLWYFTTQSSGIIHYTRTLQVIRNFSSHKG